MNKNDFKKFIIYRLFLIILLLIIAMVVNFTFKEKEIKANLSSNNNGSKNYFPNTEIKKEMLLSALLEYKIKNYKCDLSRFKEDGLLVYLLESDKVLLEKNAEKVFPIASLTKLMTAIIAKEKVKDNIITFSPFAINAFGNFGGFKASESYFKDDLIKGMLVSSSNDASYALAEKQGLNKFVSLMNQKAKDLKMNNTFFSDPAGLSSSNKSNCYDLLILIKYIYENYPDFLKVTTLKEINIVELKSGIIKNIKNDNLFSGQQNFLGGKTGYLLYLEKGGLISLFEVNNKTVVIIVLNSNFYERYDETKKVLSCIKDIF